MPAAAAIGNFKQHRLVSLGHVFGLEQVEIGGELNFTLRIARRFIQVHDLAGCADWQDPPRRRRVR